MMDASLSLYQLLDPAVLADPYPLYRRLREQDPVHWDPFLHAWIATRYQDVITVLHRFSADRIRTPEQLSRMGCDGLNPIARVMLKQLLFMDAPSHTRLRGLAAAAFSPRRVELMRVHIHEIAERLMDKILSKERGELDVIRDFAEPFPATVTAEMLGVPTADSMQLKDWSADFAEMLGNLQHNADRAPRLLNSLERFGGARNQLLARATGRGAAGVAVARRPRASGGAILSRRDESVRAVFGADRGDQGRQPRRKRDALHVPAGEL